MLDSTLNMAVRVLLIAIFSSSIANKLRRPMEFKDALSDYRLIPQSFVSSASYVVMALEILTLAGLLIANRLVVALVLALLWIFSTAMWINLVRGRSTINCGCGSPENSQSISYALVLRNLVVSIAALGLLTPTSRPRAPLEWLDGVAAGLVLFILYQVISAMSHNRSIIGSRGRSSE